MSDAVEVEVVSLSTDGRGVARHDGQAVFIAGGVPGDRVRVHLLPATAPLAGEILSVIQPSPHRVAHPCPHAQQCPGSPFGGIAYEEQLLHKHELAQRTLRKFVRDLRVAPMVASPRIWHYRNRLSLSVWQRQGHVSIGMMTEARASQGTALTECRLCESVVEELLHSIAHKFESSAWPVLVPFPNRLQIHRTRHGAGVAFTFAVGVERDHLKLLEDYLADVPGLNGFWLARGTRAGMAHFEQSHLKSLNAEPMQTFWCGQSIELNPYVFCQTNSSAADLVHARLTEWSSGTALRSVWDLYGGYGALGFAIENAKGHLNVLEVNPAVESTMSQLAAIAARSAARVIAGDLLHTLPAVAKEFGSADLIIVDPPRSGLHPRVIEIVAHSKVRLIAYLSCNPAKFGRDVQRLLSAGFCVEEVLPYDFFPQTPAIELLAILRRK